MKNLIKNIWNAPASTIAGALVASIGVIVVTDLNVPTWAIIALTATSAFLAVFSGSKPNN